MGKCTAWALLVWLMLASARAADPPPPVDEDFLEYLGTIDDGGDWTWFEDQSSRPNADKDKSVNKPEDAKSEPKQTPSEPK